MNIVIYGPQNCGKSTFTASLYRLLEKTVDKRVDYSVDYQSLDLWDNTGLWLLDETGTVDRKKEPEDINKEKRDRRDAFVKLSADVNLADAPGKIDDIFRDLISSGDELVLLISEEKIDEKNQWENESDKVGVNLLCHFISYHDKADTGTDLSTVQAYFRPGDSKVWVMRLNAQFVTSQNI